MRRNPNRNLTEIIPSQVLSRTRSVIIFISDLRLIKLNFKLGRVEFQSDSCWDFSSFLNFNWVSVILKPQTCLMHGIRKIQQLYLLKKNKTKNKCKIILYVIQLSWAKHLESVTIILIGWLNIYPNIKLLLIMIIISFFLNSLQFWIQDSILKS